LNGQHITYQLIPPPWLLTSVTLWSPYVSFPFAIGTYHSPCYNLLLSFQYYM
jgi:hypothetical protein